MLGIEVTHSDATSRALIANVSTNQPHQHSAYERFTSQEPRLALLPLTDNRYSLVWTHWTKDGADTALQLWMMRPSF